jgi:general secretion pathway protein D
LAALLAACSKPIAEQPRPMTPAELPQSPGPVTTGGYTAGRVSGKVLGPTADQGRPAAMTSAGARPDYTIPAPTVTPEGDISLSYVDSDIREIVRAVLGELLQVNYSIDPAVQGRATIQTRTPLRRDALLPTLQVLLEQNGLSLVLQNGIFRVAPAAAIGSAPALDARAQGTGSQVVPLRFASPKQLAALLEPYVAEGGRIVADPARNVLIVSGSNSTRQSLLDLIRAFDVNALAGQSYTLLPVKSGDASKAAADLKQAFDADANGSLAGTLRIIPIDRVNAVLVVSPQQQYLDRARTLFEQVDRMGDRTRRSLYVYFVQNSQAGDLQPVLQKAFGAAGGSAQKDNATPPGNVPPTAEAVQVGGTAPARAGAADQAATTGMPGATSSTTARRGSSPEPAAPDASADTSEPSSAASSGDAMLIIADKRRNALVIRATEEEYRMVEGAIRKLDVLPLQVLIEATIAEVTLNDTLRYGTQFFFSSDVGNGLLSQAAGPASTGLGSVNSTAFAGSLAPEFPGFGLVRVSGAIQYAIQALKSVTDVRVISSPHLLILDNERARLQVGADVPFISQSATSVITAGAPIVNSVSYRETGVILTVTPRINSSGLVTLDLVQEVSDVLPTTSSTISPTFSERKVESRIIVQDGDTIALAGLITDNKSKGNSGVPYLKDIPGVGLLFGRENDTTSRTELIVLITPKIVRDQRDARAITEELRKKLSPTGPLLDDGQSANGPRAKSY